MPNAIIYSRASRSKSSITAAISFCLRGSCAARECGKKIEKIARLLGSFAPIRSRRCKQVGFQLILPKAQGFLVGLDVCQQAAQIGSLLSGHAAMLIQVDCFFRHVCAPLD
jgi:hypothetical protein